MATEIAKSKKCSAETVLHLLLYSAEGESQAVPLINGNLSHLFLPLYQLTCCPTDFLESGIRRHFPPHYLTIW